MSKPANVQWLGSLTVKGIEFKIGNNGSQDFYETDQRGNYWLVLRCKGSSAWVAMCERKGSLRTLNCCLIRHDGEREEDPLYGISETASEPTALLEGLVCYIQSGVDPFRENGA